MQETQSTAPINELPKPTTKIVLLKDLGPTLPVGVHEGHVLLKDMDPKPWKLKQERELGELRARHKDANVAQYVGMVLSTMYRNLGGSSFDDMNMSERRGRVGRMFMADVFYAYLWLRCVSISNELVTHITCPFCSFKFELKADLSTTEITTADDIAALQWRYDLMDPFDVQDNRITYFMMGPAKWRSIEAGALGGGLNTGAAKAMIIRGSIEKVPELMKGALSEQDLDEMTKRDLEAVTAEIDRHGAGPDMSIEDRCRRCNNDFRISIDWGYDSFFASSSRSGASTT